MGSICWVGLVIRFEIVKSLWKIKNSGAEIIYDIRMTKYDWGGNDLRYTNDEVRLGRK